MLDKGLFVEFYRHLEVAHGWRRAEEKSVGYFYGKISQSIDDAAFYKIADYLTEATHLNSPKDFLNAIRESIRRKAAEESGTKISSIQPNYDCDEFQRFARTMRHLNQVKADYPDWRSDARQNFPEKAKRLWAEPITEDDRLYAAGRQVDVVVASMGLNLDRSGGGESDLHAA